MDTNADLQLIQNAQAGDQSAFAALIDRHYLTVYRFAFKWCRSKEDAEDITQEVFIKLAGKLHLFEHRSRFTSWLYRMTINCAKDYARTNSRWSSRRMAEPPDNGQLASPNPGPENNVLARSIHQAIDALPPKLKEAMLLVYAEGKNHKETAEILGCAETTVSWRIYKAKRTLRKVLL